MTGLHYSSVAALAVLLFFLSTVTEQAEAQTRGSSQDVPVSQMFRMAEGMVRIAEPGQMADTLSIWGDVSLPGRYIIPKGTVLPDLVSYARGPVRFRDTQETQVDWSRVRLDITVNRMGEDGREQAIQFEYRYNDPLPDGMRGFTLENNDLVSIQTRRRPIFIDYIRVIGPTLSVIVSSILIYDRLAN